MGDGFGLTGSMLQGVGISHEYKNPQTGIISYPGMMVVVCSDDMFSPANLSKTYYIRSTKNTTINGRKALDIVASLYPAALGDHPENNVGMRWIIIQSNGYFYVMNFFAGDIDTVNSDMSNDIVNSWVIGNLSQ